jgi:uncharacterized membrane protein YraQ (UPF0718 family)
MLYTLDWYDGTRIDYVNALDESFQSFKRMMTDLQADTGAVATLNIAAAKEFLSSFRSSLIPSQLDVMAFARTIVAVCTTAAVAIAAGCTRWQLYH